MRSASGVRAGSLYFAVVFAAGVVLGVPRTLFIAPALGELTAVLLEVPAMLAIAWVACGWALNKADVASRVSQRLIVGAIALMLLLVAEVSLSFLLTGKTPLEHFLGYTQPSALIGLAAQVAYAGFPLFKGTSLARRPA
jgi:hypothetical protein